MAKKPKRTSAPRAAKATSPEPQGSDGKQAKKKPPGHEHLARIRRSLADAEHVQSRASRHAAALAEVGVTAAEIAAHGAVTHRVEATLDARDEIAGDTDKAASERDAQLQRARDLLGGVRARAHLAFNLGVPRGKADDAALRAFGVGMHMPSSAGGLGPALRRVERALQVPARKKAMAARGFGATQLAELRDAVKAATHAAAGGAAVRKQGATQRQTLDADVAEMRRLTAYLRGAGNTTRDGTLRAEFDPPPAARPRKPGEDKPEPPASPQDPAAK